MNPEIERKTIELVGVKFSSEGDGAFSGYCSVFGELDDGGDIAMPGSYKETIPGFLDSGFTAHSHDWTYNGVIGYPTEAREDETGLFVVSAFHSTTDAQSVRTKMSERQAAGKAVKLSIGWRPLAVKFIDKADYATELPKYLVPAKLEAGLAKAQKFSRVRLLLKTQLYEYSVVTVPMLTSAATTSVKTSVKQADKEQPMPATNSAISVKGMFEEELAERVPSPWDLWEVFCCVIWNLLSLDYAISETNAPVDVVALMDEAIAEYTARLRAAILMMLTAEDTAVGEDEGVVEYDGAGKAIVPAATVKPLTRPISAVQLVKQAEFVDHAIAALSTRFKKLSELRTKEGRTISAATAERMKTSQGKIKDTMGHMKDVHDDLGELIKLAAPKEEESDTEKANEAARLSKAATDELARFELIRFQTASIM